MTGLHGWCPPPKVAITFTGSFRKISSFIVNNSRLNLFEKRLELFARTSLARFKLFGSPKTMNESTFREGRLAFKASEYRVDISII